MGLFFILVVLSATQHGLTQDVSPLPRLQNNKLDVGDDTTLPNADYIECGRERKLTGRLRTLTLREALTTDNFKNQPFTSGLLSNHPIPGKEARFKMVEIRTGRRYLYALQDDPSGERAFWVNQSVHKVEPYPYVDIPVNPTADQPKYVFTPDFSGYSWTVTPLGNGFLRLRHVAESHQIRQFNYLPPDQKGGPVSYAMQYRDYGYTMETGFLVETEHSFAYMHYSEGRWTLHLQRQACCPRIGERIFSNHVLSSVNLYETVHRKYYLKPITSTKDYVIPVV